MRRQERTCNSARGQALASECIVRERPVARVAPLRLVMCHRGPQKKPPPLRQRQRAHAPRACDNAATFPQITPRKTLIPAVPMMVRLINDVSTTARAESADAAEAPPILRVSRVFLIIDGDGFRSKFSTTLGPPCLRAHARPPHETQRRARQERPLCQERGVGKIRRVRSRCGGGPLSRSRRSGGRGLRAVR